MKITLLGLEFHIGNRGCEALSYSFLEELGKIATQKNEGIEISAIVFSDGDVLHLPEGITSIRNIIIKPKKVSFWKSCREAFRESDMIVDFSMGDSFSDIYGVKRYFITTMLKELAVRSKVPYVLGAQTYGPYSRKWVEKWAVSIIQRARLVYTRDILSKEYVEKISNRVIELTTDVAFSLPVVQLCKIENCDKVKVGLNVSGLLWQGGYTGKNQFMLAVDYQKYCKAIIEYLVKSGQYEVYLIPHVGNKGEQSLESDYVPSNILKELYPAVHIIDDGKSASEIKGYISQMDVFIGARMHATIAAFSTGVATIPFSYSRKFEGLYSTLEYPYVIEALKWDTDEAIAKTKNYIDDYTTLTENVKKSLGKVNDYQCVFREKLIDVMDECKGRK